MSIKFLIAALSVVTIVAVISGELAKSQSPRAKAARAEASGQARKAQTALSAAKTDQARADANVAQGEMTRLKRQLAESYLDRGLRLCDEGDAGRGSLWMARALTVLSPTGGGHSTIEAGRRNVPRDPEHAIRANLGAWQSSISRLKRVLPHQRNVTRVAYSPDGKTVLTAGFDTTARLWDAATGKPIGAPLQHQGIVYAIAYSPDGKKVLTGSQDKTARLWDAATGKPIGPTFQHQGPVYAVAFSPDGKTVLTGSEDKTARLWDAATGEPIGAPLQHQDSVNAVAYSPDGKTVLTATGDTARQWEAATGKPIGAPLKAFVRAVAYSPDGKMLLTGCWDNTARLWDAATGKPIGALQHPAPVDAVAYSPDGKTVLTGGGSGGPRANTLSEGGEARLWDVATGKPIGAPLGDQNDAYVVLYSPDGKTVLARGGGSDKTAWLWDAATAKPIGAPLKHQDVLYAMAFSPDSKTVLTGSWDKTARLWDAATGKPIGAPLEHQGSVRAVAFSPDGKTVLTGSDDKTARLWEATTGKPIGAPLPHQGPVYAVAYSPDGKTILTATDGTARLWDAATGKPIGAPLQHEDCLNAIAYSPDGKRVLTGSQDKTARLWDATTGKPISAPLQHQGPVFAVAYSPDGKTVVTGSFDNTARLWDAATGKPIGASLQHQGLVWAVAYSPDGKTVLTGSEDKTARLWDAATGKPIGPPLQQQGRVNAVLYSPDGKTVLAGSGDAAARLWQAPVPMEGEPERINLSVELATGIKIAEGGADHALSTAEWLDGERRLEPPGPLPAPNPSAVVTHDADVAYMPDTGDLSLTPAAMPDIDSARPDGVAIPGGQGDRIVVTQSDVQGPGGRGARKNADDGTMWVTELDGRLGGGRLPHIVADVDRVYVTRYVNKEGGVTALDVRTGQVLWHSPGPEDNLLVSGDLLLATGADGAGGGPWLLARRTASGKEAFRVALPANTPANDFDALPIKEATGWFVVQKEDAPGGAGVALLIDRAGRVRHRLDRKVVAVMAAGDERLVLTSRDVIRLGPDGPPRWAVPFARQEWIAGGGLIPLAGGDVVAYLYCHIADSGVEVLRLDPGTGRKKWESWCASLGVMHSKYEHHAVVEVTGGRLKVTSRGSAGTFVEALDAQTGHSVGRRVIKSCQ